MQSLDLTAAARRELNDDVAPRARSAVLEGKGDLSKRATMTFIVMDVGTTRATSVPRIGEDFGRQKIKLLF